VQAIRAVAVLGFIGTPAARKLLRDLGTGAARSRLTQEANAASRGHSYRRLLSEMEAHRLIENGRISRNRAVAQKIDLPRVSWHFLVEPSRLGSISPFLQVNNRGDSFASETSDRIRISQEATMSMIPPVRCIGHSEQAAKRQRVDGLRSVG
jgi:hypothetical protein